MATHEATTHPAIDPRRAALALQATCELDALLSLVRDQVKRLDDAGALRGLVTRSQELTAAVISALDDDADGVGDIYFRVFREPMAV